MILLMAEHPKFSQLILRLIAPLLAGVQVTIQPRKIEVALLRRVCLLLRTEAALLRVMALTQPLRLHQIPQQLQTLNLTHHQAAHPVKVDHRFGLYGKAQ